MYKLCIRRTPKSTAFPLPVGFVIRSVNLHKAHHQYAHRTAEHCSAEENEPPHYLQFQPSFKGTDLATVFLAFFDFAVQQARTAMPEPTAATAPAVMQIILMVFFFILLLLLYCFFGFRCHNAVQLGI